MKRVLIIWVAILFLEILLPGFTGGEVMASQPGDGAALLNQQLDPTPSPGLTASPRTTPTPTGRVMPAVGSNAGLLIGASVLVLIIIVGVLTARKRQYH